MTSDLRYRLELRRVGRDMAVTMDAVLPMSPPLTRAVLSTGTSRRPLRIWCAPVLPGPEGVTSPLAGVSGWAQVDRPDPACSLLLDFGDMGTRHHRLTFTAPPLEPAPEGIHCAAQLGSDEPGTYAQPHGDRTKLAVATHRNGVGGAERWLDRLLSALTGDPEIELVTTAALDEHGSAWPLRASRDGLIDHRSLDRAVSAAAQWLRRGRPSLLLANTVGTFPVAEAARRLGIPYVVAVHETCTPAGFWLSSYPGNDVSVAVAEAYVNCLEQADAVAFVSVATASLFRGFAAIPQAVVVPFGVHAAAGGREPSRSRTRRELGIDLDAVVFVTVGVLSDRKNFGLMIVAFARLRHQGIDATLVIVGLDESMYGDFLHAVVREAHCEDHIRLIPTTPAIRQYLKAADVFISLSDNESRPTVILEAMSEGLPIIAARAPGVEETLSGHACQLLCDTNDLDAATEAMRGGLEILRGRNPAAHGAASHERPTENWITDLRQVLLDASGANRRQR